MVTVKKTGKSWGVFLDGALIEGGFFYRESAMRCARDLRLALCCGQNGVN